MKNNIILSADATQVIRNLQHSCGTFDYYNDTLTGLFNYILNQSDEIGMSDTEAIHTLRALQYIREDLATIANRQAPTPTALDTEETADKVETAFEGVSLPSQPHPAPVDQLDEPREMLADVKRAWQKVNELQTVISEAITHAQNAGEKYESIACDLADVNGDLETTVSALDAVMAIDPDNYEPQEPTKAETVALYINRSRELITFGKELLDDALDHAVHYDYKPLIRRLRTARELAIKAVDGIEELAERADNTLGKDTDEPENVTSEEVAARVEATFENIGMTEKDEELTKETALEKADTYVKNAKQSLRDALLQLDNALDLVQHRDVNGVPVDDNIISMQVDLTKLRLLLTEKVFDPVFEYIEKGMHSKADSQQC